jgi:hypothetical protein
MGVEEVMEQIRTRLGGLSERDRLVIQAVYETLERSGPGRPSLSFVGENLRPEDYQTLPEQEKVTLAQRVQEENKHWLARQFSAFNAAWMAVVDGKVVAFSERFEDYPSPEKIVSLCQQTGKVPFLFLNPQWLLIEEQSAWTPLLSLAPTLSLDFHTRTTTIAS